MNEIHLPEGLHVYNIAIGPTNLMVGQGYREKEGVKIIAINQKDAFGYYVATHLHSLENFDESVDHIIEEGRECMISIGDVTEESGYIPMTRSALEKILEDMKKDEGSKK